MRPEKKLQVWVSVAQIFAAIAIVTGTVAVGINYVTAQGKRIEQHQVSLTELTTQVQVLNAKVDTFIDKQDEFNRNVEEFIKEQAKVNNNLSKLVQRLAIDSNKMGLDLGILKKQAEKK